MWLEPLKNQKKPVMAKMENPASEVKGCSPSQLSPAITVMLKVPDHQVAGHQAGDGKLGPLIDDSGHFYKPLQNDGRGSHELAFYTSFSTDTRIPDHIRKFFPVFYGTRHLEASDGSGLYPHLALEDTVSSRINPSVLDAKIGSRTWYPQAAEDYIIKCLKKDRETTSLELGFRVSGLRVYGNKETGFWKPDKKCVLNFSIEDTRLALRKFVSSNPSTDSDIKPDCSFASAVYGGPAGILAQLLKLKSWFEEQTIFHFYSCSVLMVYEKESILQGRNSAGNTDNFFGSSLNIVTAAEWAGLNTLGLSIARTDIRLDGLVPLHSHPRASELFFVNKGIVLAGFLDTQNRAFQKILKEGDVFVFPRGLLHFSLNAGYDLATAYSVFNSQNPGVVAIAGAMFKTDLDMIYKITKGFLSDHIKNVTFPDSSSLNGQQFRNFNPII
ncbi:hypothetical protein GBA52_017098 [Prunus armeniaca]|nr:hypothetical protein GBA52_017098 [Prunus armeniaca]